MSCIKNKQSENTVKTIMSGSFLKEKMLFMPLDSSFFLQSLYLQEQIKE